MRLDCDPQQPLRPPAAQEVSEAAWQGKLPSPGEPLVTEHSIHGETK